MVALPSPWLDEPDGVAMVDGDGVDGKWAVVEAELPVGLALTLDRIGVSVGCVAHGQPRDLCVRLPTSLYSAGDRGPPTR